MVSLNEKRSKVRYMVQNKTEWTDDTNKFGQRMLEKMGWTSGVGLGKNEDGRTDHVNVKLKSNLKGVGFINGKYDDTWITHGAAFDSVLQQLQQSHGSPSSPSASLTDMSQRVQQTKTRFTYKKQSSGKDLSSRSHHELDCIFGWNKNLKNQQETITETVEQSNPEEKETSSNLYVTSKQSVHDYFKEKSLARAKALVDESARIVKESTEQQIDTDKKKKKKKRKYIDTEEQNEVEMVSSEQVISEDPPVDVLDEQDVSTSENVKRSKKSRKNQLDNDAQPETSNDIDPQENSDEPVKKKKKKQKELESDSIVEEPSKDAQLLFVGSNLTDLNGYVGWQVESSLEQIIKAKEKKQKERQRKSRLTS